MHNFADYTQLYHHFDHLNVNTACQLINEDLDIIASQSEQLGLKLNVKKCFAICLSIRKKRGYVKSKLNLEINGHRLQVVNSVKII